MRFSWTFPARQEKGSGWYAVAGAILTALVVWGFLWGYPFMSVVVLTLAGVYLFMDANARGDVGVEVGASGVQIDGRLHDFASIQAFSVIYEGNRPAALRLALRQNAIAQVDAPIAEGVDVPSLRAFLSTQAQESGATEFGLTERLVRWFKL